MLRQSGVVIGDYVMTLSAEELFSLLMENHANYRGNATLSGGWEASVNESVQCLLLDKIFILDRSLAVASALNGAVIASALFLSVADLFNIEGRIIIPSLIAAFGVLYAISGYVESRYVKKEMSQFLYPWYEDSGPNIGG